MLAVLSILIASYAMDAHLQTRINLYLRERMHVDHLTDAGVAIAEVILLNYQDVPSDTSELDESMLEEKLEDDRWFLEKVALKGNRVLDTGAVPVDALDPDGGTVTVQIEPIESKWNINRLYAGGDPNFAKIWDAILTVSGVPEDYKDGIISSWCDWRDTDETKTGDEGAETEFYRECFEDYRDARGRGDPKDANYRPKCRNGEITDLDELKCLKGFNEFEEKYISADALLDGGVLNPDEKEENQITVKGIRKFFTVYGSGKINANVADADTLSTVPGIYQGESGDSDYALAESATNAMELAGSIVQLRTQEGSLAENIAEMNKSMGEDLGPFKDWNDLQSRLNEGHNSGTDYIQEEANQYLSYQPDKYFKVTVIGHALGIVHKIVATAIVEDSKVRYIRWQEDP